MFHIIIDHPPEHEAEVVRATTAIIDPHFAPRRPPIDRVPASGAPCAHRRRRAACAPR
jgi:hypothetical protein